MTLNYRTEAFNKLGLLAAPAAAAPASAQLAPGVRMRPEIGAAYGRLGKAMTSHGAAGVRAVWAEDRVVNSPDTAVLRREEVIAVMERAVLDYQDFGKHVTLLGETPQVVVTKCDTMAPIRGSDAGKQTSRPFTEVWAECSDG